MTRKKLLFIAAALILAATVGLALIFWLNRDQPPQSGSARFVSTDNGAAYKSTQPGQNRS